MTARLPVVRISGRWRQMPSGDWLPISAGGTGATDQAGARAALDVQQLNANLTALAAQSGAMGKVFYFTSAGAGALADTSVFGRSFWNAADQADGRSKLGLGTAATREATTSATDTTSERLWRTNDLKKQTSTSDTTSGSVLLNGAHGLGGRIIFTSSADVTARTATQFTTDTNPTGAPSSSTHNTLTFYNPDAGGRTLLLAQAVNTNDLYIRGQSNGAWSNGWNKFWHDGNLTKQTSSTDTTAGAVLVNGAHGIGGGVVSTETNLNSYLTGGKYITPITGLTNLPAGWSQTRHIMEVAGAAGSYGSQTLYDAGTAGNRVATRTWSGSGFTPWVESWHSGNLIKQTNQLDSTAGAAMVMGNSGVGPFGLGAIGNTITDMNNLTYSGLGRVAALNVPNAPTAGVGYGIGMPHADGMTTLGGQLFLNYTNDVGNYLAKPRFFMRSKSAAATFGNWYELAPLDGPSFTGTVTMAGQLNMSAQITYEANNYGTGWARGLSYLDGGTTAAGIGGYGNAGVVETVYMGYGASPWVAPYRVEVTSAKVSLYGLTVIESGQLQTKGQSEGLRLYATAGANTTFLTFYDNQSTPARVGYFGKASTGNNDVYLVAEQGEVRIQRTGLAILTSNATGATLNGYTKLGDTAPAIKQKKLTGTTASVQGNAVTVAHGLTSSKILDARVTIFYAAGSGIPTNHPVAGYQAGTGFDSTNVTVSCIAGNSANILSKPFTVLITYEE